MTRSSDAVTTNPSNPDVVLIGAGIMSATLAIILKELDPKLKIEIHEVLGCEAQESSNAWNNAGTGHAALCELNYTPQREDGSIDISKALQVNTEFDLSRQLWSYLTKRYQTLSAHHCYRGLEFSGDKQQIQEWVPLVMEGRAAGETVAATRMRT